MSFLTILWLINTVSIHESTTILSDNGDYRQIKDIKIGDWIPVIGHPTKQITNILSFSITNNPENDAECMYINNTCSPAFLCLGYHSILTSAITEEQEKRMNELRIPRRNLDGQKLILACLHTDFKKIDNKEIYKLYHIVLQHYDPSKHYGIYANGGIISETMSQMVYDRLVGKHDKIEVRNKNSSDMELEVFA